MSDEIIIPSRRRWLTLADISQDLPQIYFCANPLDQYLSRGSVTFPLGDTPEGYLHIPSLLPPGTVQAYWGRGSHSEPHSRRKPRIVLMSEEYVQSNPEQLRNHKVDPILNPRSIELEGEVIENPRLWGLHFVVDPITRHVWNDDRFVRTGTYVTPIFDLSEFYVPGDSSQ